MGFTGARTCCRVPQHRSRTRGPGGIVLAATTDFTASAPVVLEAAHGEAALGTNATAVLSDKGTGAAYICGYGAATTQTSAQGYTTTEADQGLVPLLDLRDSRGNVKPGWAQTLALTAPYGGQDEVPGGKVGAITYVLTPRRWQGLQGNRAGAGPPPAHAAYVGVGLAAPGLVSLTINGVAHTAQGQADGSASVAYFPVATPATTGAATVTVGAGGHVAGLWLHADNSTAAQAAPRASTHAPRGTAGAPPADLGAVLAWIDCGSGSDLPISAPHIALALAISAGGPASPGSRPSPAASALLYFPPSAAAGAPVATAGKCAANADALAALLAATEATWQDRLGPPRGDAEAEAGGGSGAEVVARFANGDARAMRAVAVATQQLVMMTERQHDGLRVLKGTRREPFNFTPMAVNSISFGSPHVHPMGVHRTCGA